MKVRGEVISGTGVRDLGSWGGIRWCGGGHGSELCWRMSALVGVIHALIAVNRSMTKLVADLQVGRELGLGFQDGEFWGF